VLTALPRDRVRRCAADVSRPNDVKRIVQTALELGEGRLDILVNNAAISPRDSLEKVNLEDRQQTLAINVTGPMPDQLMFCLGGSTQVLLRQVES